MTNTPYEVGEFRTLGIPEFHQRPGRAAELLAYEIPLTRIIEDNSLKTLEKRMRKASGRLVRGKLSAVLSIWAGPGGRNLTLGGVASILSSGRG